MKKANILKKYKKEEVRHEKALKKEEKRHEKSEGKSIKGLIKKPCKKKHGKWNHPLEVE